jgi:endonuclease/exonuclease/phosphatase (EEP) superfamily protein YafD
MFALKYINILICGIMLIMTNSRAASNRNGLANRFIIPPLEESFLVFGSHQEKLMSAKSIKIFVWNLYKGDKKNWSSDFQQLVKGHDILLLQEGYLNNNMRKIFESSDQYRYEMAVSFIYKNEQAATGTVLGSRFPSHRSGFIRSEFFEPFIKTPKTMTYAFYPFQEKAESLLVINIHAINFSNFDGFKRQIDQAIELISNHSGPIVFGGDFNTRTKQRLDYLKKKLAEYNLAELPFRNDVRTSVVGLPLDHVFVRNLLIKDSQVLKTVKTSDHLPLQAELVYTGL